MSAVTFETIVFTWTCLKWAQAVLWGMVTRQHHLFLSKGCLCRGLTLDPPALFFFACGSFILPPTAPQLPACFKFDHFLQ